MMTSSEHPVSVAIAFPTSNPEGEASACVVLGESLPDVPTWSIETLNAGPSRSSPAYGRHLEATTGSSFDWSDEFRFDRRTGRLTSFVLKTPEAGPLDPAIARSWLALPRTTGIPVLDRRENGFHVDPLDLRYLAEEACILVVACSTLPLADRHSLRLAIGRDTDLLFHQGRYSGWILASPVAHLVSSSGERAAGVDDHHLDEPLREYLSLVMEPNISRMSDADPDLQAALHTLRTRVRSLAGRPARILESAIERVLETFYPD
jgi:hypothetical protein